MEKMRTFSVDYPGTIPAVINVSPEAFEEEAKMAMAIKLFELGRLTTGQAAALAGIPRVAFLLQCHRFGAASAEWSDEELEYEFRGKL
ncbi:MAG: UPF0175 family protein [Candidatus Electrothrix scaldis]|nr:MAG: UPF0175 family protein [Candidatus Electrothrix sp. GW3-3]